MPAVRTRKAPWARRMLIAATAIVAAIPLTATPTAAATHEFDPVALTDQGLVQGVKVGNVREFLGIPYAAPPVGACAGRRLSRPRAGTACATRVRSAPTAPSPRRRSAGPAPGGLPVPQRLPPAADRRSSRSAGMVWIHGGALVSGESDDYDPTPLVSGASSW